MEALDDEQAAAAQLQRQARLCAKSMQVNSQRFAPGGLLHKVYVAGVMRCSFDARA